MANEDMLRVIRLICCRKHLYRYTVGRVRSCDLLVIFSLTPFSKPEQLAPRVTPPKPFSEIHPPTHAHAHTHAHTLLSSALACKIEPWCPETNREGGGKRGRKWKGGWDSWVVYIHKSLALGEHTLNSTKLSSTHPHLPCTNTHTHTHTRPESDAYILIGLSAFHGQHGQLFPEHTHKKKKTSTVSYTAGERAQIRFEILIIETFQIRF